MTDINVLKKRKILEENTYQMTILVKDLHEGSFFMEKISEQLINEIEQKINPVLSTYFETTKNIYDYGFDKMSDFIRSIILENSMYDNESDYMVKYNSESGSRRVRRNDWVRRLKENRRKFQFRSSKSYYHYLYQQLATPIGSRQLIDQYNTNSLDAIVDRIIEDAEIWKSSGKKNLIECPNFPYVGRVNVCNILRSDLFCDICNIIRIHFNGNLKQAMYSTTLDMILNPIFSSSRGKVEVTLSADKKYIAEIFNDERYSLTYFDIPDNIAETEFNSSGVIKIPRIDDLDLSIISFLTNNAKIDLSAPSSVLAPQQMTTVSAICHAVYHGKTVNNEQRENIERRLKRYNFPIKVTTPNNEFRWNILSSAMLSTDSDSKNNASKLFIYTLGDTITRALVENRVLKIPASKMNALKASGRTLLLQLQLDRIARSFEGNYTVNYKYNRIVQIMLLRSKSPKKNLEIIKDALEDIKINLDGKIVENYHINGSEITVKFCPLNDIEMLDIIDNDGYKSLLEERDIEESNPTT